MNCRFTQFCNLLTVCICCSPLQDVGLYRPPSFLEYSGLINISPNLMYCWLYIAVYQYSKTNMMHFLFNLLRIKGHYMFQTLLAHLQGVMHKWHLVYCMHVSLLAAPGLEWNWHSTPILLQPTDITCTQYAKCRLWSTSWRWASPAQNIWGP
jgi:hypothetical protein